MFKKVLALLLTVALTATVAIGGTVAYLQDTDEQANTMTMGSVKIDQHEYQRKGTDGNYETATVDDRTSYVLEAFTQDKALYPAIIPNGGTVNGVTFNYDEIPVRMSQVDSYGGASVFNTPNAVDKFITVENTGKSDAYVRTLVAFEMGTITDADEYMNKVISAEVRADKEGKGAQPWMYGDKLVANINGSNYLVYELIYVGATISSGYRHPNGVLPAGDTTYPSLCQVYMTAESGNEECEKIDGNGNGKFDIIVLSQAVQTKGFENAQLALDTAFGGVTAEKCVEWLTAIAPKVVTSGEELQDAIDNGNNNIVLGDDIDLSGGITIG